MNDKPYTERTGGSYVAENGDLKKVAGTEPTPPKAPAKPAATEPKTPKEGK